MSIHFYLVRHALKEKAIGDVPITSKGVKQAQETAAYLGTLPINAIVSSPLRRAQETAGFIAEKTRCTISVDDRLRERANWGDLPGQSFEEFVEIWDRCTREPDYIPPVGDSARQASERMSSLLTELTREYPTGSHIVVVTHGGLITDYLVNSFPADELNPFHPQFVLEQSQLVAECSITKLIYTDHKFTIDYFAFVNHLTC